MRLQYYITVGFLIGLFNSGCEYEADIIPKNYPYITLKEINKINSNGITIVASVSSLGDDIIVDYGFVWNKSEMPDLDDYRLSIPDKPAEGLFSANITNNLDTNSMYWIRPYIISKKYTVYGNAMQVVSQGSLPPVIKYFDPDSGKTGNQIKIISENINSNPDKTIVLFNDIQARVLKVTQSEILIEVPFLVENAMISVLVDNIYFTFKDTFKMVSPWMKIGSSINLEELFETYPYGFSINGKGYFCYEKLMEYDPVGNMWTEKKEFPGVPRYRAAVFSKNNKGYIGLGTDYSKAFWEYDPACDEWKQTADFPGNELADPLCFPLNDCVYIGLAEGTSKEFWEYNTVADTWTKKGSFPFVRDYSAFGTIIEGKAYAGFGYYLKDFYSYDPKNDQWKHLGLIPGNENYLIDAFSISDIGYFIYVHFGENEIFRYLWKYNPDSNTWLKLIECPCYLKYCFTIDNYCYFLDHSFELWRFDPSKI